MSKYALATAALLPHHLSFYHISISAQNCHRIFLWSPQICFSDSSFWLSGTWEMTTYQAVSLSKAAQGLHRQIGRLSPSRSQKPSCKRVSGGFHLPGTESHQASPQRPERSLEILLDRVLALLRKPLVDHTESQAVLFPRRPPFPCTASNSYLTAHPHH